ncbi:hypothetical protein B0T16DRAFT_447187 [Cercophora newfieldiana]|uniref:Uncharacterized protein n=1 Tax=Cercophora newfieldiana TaxID=92897 RepID=A0AA39XZG2_9PEZI|nr:hypothetical protein B0T16DRAFT_447187 [Cercophora newfieldiana]
MDPYHFPYPTNNNRIVESCRIPKWHELLSDTDSLSSISPPDRVPTDEEVEIVASQKKIRDAIASYNDSCTIHDSFAIHNEWVKGFLDRIKFDNIVEAADRINGRIEAAKKAGTADEHSEEERAVVMGVHSHAIVIKASMQWMKEMVPRNKTDRWARLDSMIKAHNKMVHTFLANTTDEVARATAIVRQFYGNAKMNRFWYFIKVEGYPVLIELWREDGVLRYMTIEHADMVNARRMEEYRKQGIEPITAN